VASSEAKCEYGTESGESNTGRVSAGGFYHVTARSRLARSLELLNHLFL
jgi:hypothetical protein